MRSALVLIPPPIQGIGNASGFTMQVELRDGSFDYTKLQTLSRTIAADGNSQTGLHASGHAVPRGRSAATGDWSIG